MRRGPPFGSAALSGSCRHARGTPCPLRENQEPMDSSLSPAPGTTQFELALPEQTRMIEALQRLLQEQTGADVLRVETHISFVLVARDFAYKFKKAINPGFLDFTTLALRRRFCDEELRLNRRLAPALYLDVVTVTGRPDAPRLSGSGVVIDCAVRMRPFPQDDLWDRIAARGALQASHTDALVGPLCDFHRAAAVADATGWLGSAAQVRAPVLDNLVALGTLFTGAADRARLDRLRTWEDEAFSSLQGVFTERLRAGRVRECHGDLHLGNVAQIDGRPTVFDGIEFNDDFRWIDVMSDLAFLAMDLQAHGRADLGQRFVNAYLERSGDYAGTRVLRYYTVHRALVRAKVAALRASQQAGAATAQAQAYLDMALAAIGTPRPALLITHGPSGSGKTTLTQGLIESLGAIRIRADVERKRIFGLDALARSNSALNAGLYASEATRATYSRLCELARPALQGGFCVVLDATFLRRAQRDLARQLAADLGLRFFIIDFSTDEAVLRERVSRRAARADDASEADLAVLAAQLRDAEALGPDERPDVHECRPLPALAGAAPQADWSMLQAMLAPA
jgi:uncharacterized protein